MEILDCLGYNVKFWKLSYGCGADQVEFGQTYRDSYCCVLQAAAAMCVGMGSFRDPLEAQGLAHFLGMFWSYYTCISELHYSVLCYLERFECLYFIELNRHLQTCITFPVVYILFQIYKKLVFFCFTQSFAV